MFNANKFVRDFENMDMLKIVLNFRKLGNLDVRILEYLCKLPTEVYSEVSDVRVFRGNYSELAKVIQYDDQCNVRKACIRLENNGLITINKNGRNITGIVLNKYWMIKVRDAEK